MATTSARRRRPWRTGGLATSNRCDPLGHAHTRQGAQRHGVNRFELPHRFVGAERRQFGAVITLIFDGGGTYSSYEFQLVFVLALHFVQHLPPSLPFSVLALSLLRISMIPDPTGSPWMPMTVRGCVPLCMYLDNEKCVYGILLRRISCFRVDRHGYTWVPVLRSRSAREMARWADDHLSGRAMMMM